MPTFSYTGITKKGKKIKGVKDSLSKTSLLVELKQSGIFISDIEKITSKKKLPINISFGNNKNQQSDIFFQLSLLLKSGIPLVEALKIVAESVRNERLKRMLLDTSSSVSEGKKFSVALEKHKHIIDEMHINLISISENIGRLADVLLDIAAYEEEKKKAFDKIRSAMVYPLTVFILGLGVVGFLLSYVVPKMEKVFSSVNREIPGSTKILIAVGDIIKNHGLWFTILLLILATGLRLFYSKNKDFRMAIDRKLYNLTFIKEILLSKFTHVFSFLLKEGLVMTDALKSSSRTLNNAYLQAIVYKIEDEVKGGTKLSISVKKNSVFPELFVAAIVTGERTGNLYQILNRVSEFYRKRVDKFSSTFISIIEPLFIVLIGIVVGFIVISIMGPLFELNTLVK